MSNGMETALVALIACLVGGILVLLFFMLRGNRRANASNARLIVETGEHVLGRLARIESILESKFEASLSANRQSRPATTPPEDKTAKKRRRRSRSRLRHSSTGERA